MECGGFKEKARPKEIVPPKKRGTIRRCDLVRGSVTVGVGFSMFKLQPNHHVGYNSLPVAWEAEIELSAPSPALPLPAHQYIPPW